MEVCAYCGEQIVGDEVRWNDDVFCSQDCLQEYDVALDDYEEPYEYNSDY